MLVAAIPQQRLIEMEKEDEEDIDDRTILSAMRGMGRAFGRVSIHAPGKLLTGHPHKNQGRFQ
jgi:hypothetical protein